MKVKSQPSTAGKDDASKDKKEKKSKALKRADFKTWPEYCEYKKTQCAERIKKLQERIEYWEKVKPNEQLGKIEKKQKKLEKMREALAALEKELAEEAKEVK